MTAGMRTRRVAPLNFDAPLQPVGVSWENVKVNKCQIGNISPSWPQVSQNSVLMYDGVVVRMQLSAGALMSSQEHDLETTTLSLTVKLKTSRIVN